MCDANGSVLPRRGMRKLSALVLPPPNRPSAMGRRRVCGVFAAEVHRSARCSYGSRTDTSLRSNTRG